MVWEQRCGGHSPLPQSAWDNKLWTVLITLETDASCQIPAQLPTFYSCVISASLQTWKMEFTTIVIVKGKLNRSHIFQESPVWTIQRSVKEFRNLRWNHFMSKFLLRKKNLLKNQPTCYAKTLTKCFYWWWGSNKLNLEARNDQKLESWVSRANDFLLVVNATTAPFQQSLKRRATI